MTILASDSLNRTANASSLGTSDSYAGGTNRAWVVLGSAVYGIDANGCAYCSTVASSGHGVAYMDTGNANGNITATIKNVAGNYPKLAFRITDGENFLFVEHQMSENQLQLRKYVGGSGTTIATKASAGLTASDTIKITCNGTAITVYLNDVQVITATDATNQTATKWGFNSYSYTGARFDNFIVEDFNTGATTQDGTASIIGTGTLASTGRILKNSSAGLIGIGTLSATATKIQNALASMVGTGTLTATPVTIKNGQASILGQGIIVGNADTLTSVVFVDGSVAFKGNGLLTTNGITLMNGNVTLQGQGIFTSEATTVHLPSTIDGVFNVLGTGFLTVEGEVIEFIKPEIPSLTIDVLVELLFEIENKIELSSEIENTTTIHTDLENKVSLTFNL